MADFNINVIVSTRGAAQGVADLDRRFTTLERSILRIQRVVGAVFAFGAIAGGIRAITDLSDALVNAENRFRALGFEGAKTAQVTAQVFEIANKGRVAFEGVAETFARTTRSLRNLGAGEEEVIDFTRTLTQAVAISGATTLEAEGALRQFSQGLGRGELRGQELISVLEQLPIVADIIAKSLGVDVVKLNELAAQGTITGEVIRKAFAEAREEIAERFARTIPTVGQAFSVLRNTIIQVGGGFLLASGAAEGFANAILTVADNLETVLRVLGAVAIALTLGFGIPVAIKLIGTLTSIFAGNFTKAIALAIGFLTTFSDAIKFTNDGVATLADVALAVADRLGAVFAKLKSIAMEAFDAIIEQVTSFLGSFGLLDITVEGSAVAVARSLDVIVAVFSAGFAAIEEIVGNFGPVVEEAFVVSLNGTIAAVETGLEFIVNGFLSLPSKLIDAGKRAIQAFGGAIVTGFNVVVEFVKTIPDKIEAALKGLFTTGVDAGVDLVKGIGKAIDDSVSVEGGKIAFSLGRLEVPASGALAAVGEASSKAFTDTLAKAPVSEELEKVLEGARARGVARAADVGGDVGKEIVNSADRELRAASARLAEAVEGLFEGFASFLNISDDQLKQLGTNITNVFSKVDTNIGGVIQGAITKISDFTGLSSTELANLGGVAGIIFDELGIDIESTFGPKAATAIRIFSRISTDQLNTIFKVGSSVFSGISTAITSIIPAAVSFGQGAVSAFTSATAAAIGLDIALGPIILVFLAIAAAVVVLIVIFGSLGDALEFLSDLFTKLGGDGSTAAKILQIVFAPVILPIIAIIEVVKFLINLFSDLGSAGSTVGKILEFALAPIIIPIVLIIEAVKFLIGLFSDLGSAGGVVGRILQIAFAPIIITFRVIIEVIQFLIRLFTGGGGLGSAFQIVGTIAQAALLPIIATIRLVIAVAQVLASFLSGALRASFQLVGAVAAGTFRLIAAVAQTTFNVIRAAGQALFASLRAVLTGFSSVASGVFNAVRAIAVGSFNTILSAGRSLGVGLGAVARSIGGIFSSVFSGIAAAAKSAFASVIAGAKSAVGAISGIAGSVGGIAGGIIGGVSKGVKKVGSSIKKGIKKLFGEGGVINGPVALDGPGLAGRSFARGGPLPRNTAISDASNITQTSSLGIAGESGPEAILPLSKTSVGLGVTATLSEDLISSLGGQSRRSDDQQPTQIIQNRVVLIETNNQTIQELREQVLDQGASVEQRTDVVIAEILSGLAA